jgi:hypothetical protein
MKPIDRSEVLPIGEYEAVRVPFRARVLAAKQARYLPVGANMTVLFENRDSALLQIQEMLRTERITSEAAIRHEIETYNELVPGDHELSTTVFIEYPDKDERDRMLTALAGLEGRFYVDVDGERLPGTPDPRGTDPTRAMAVQYVKIPLSATAEAALRAGSGIVTFGVDHPAYRAQAVIPAPLRASIQADFEG